MTDCHLLSDSFEKDIHYKPEYFISPDYLGNSPEPDEIDNVEVLSLSIIDPSTIKEYIKTQTLFPPKILLPSKITQRAPSKPRQRIPAKANNFTNERIKKVKKYLDKRRKRITVSKITYSCRQEAARNRTRVGGRFISKQHAEMLSKD